MMTGLLKLAQQKIFGRGKSKAAQQRRTVRERFRLFTGNAGETVEISGRKYYVAADGSFRLTLNESRNVDLIRRRARKQELEERSQAGIVNSRDKSRFRTGKDKRAGCYATRPATLADFKAIEARKLGPGVPLSELLKAA